MTPLGVEALVLAERLAFEALRAMVRQDPVLARAWDRWILARHAAANARLEAGADQ